MFRRYQSGDGTQEFIPIAVLLCCALLAHYGAVSFALIFTPIAGLLQALLQANTEPFRKRPNRNEEQSSKNEERTKNTPSSGPNIIQMERSMIT